MPLKNWCLIHARWLKSSLKHSICFCGIFPSLKQNFIAHLSSKESSHPDWVFGIHQLWQSGFSRVYSNCCCSCSFEPEIIEIGQLSHKMYSNNILNFQESTIILNAHTKKVWKLIVCTSYLSLFVILFFYHHKWWMIVLSIAEQHFLLQSFFLSSSALLYMNIILRILFIDNVNIKHSNNKASVHGFVRYKTWLMFMIHHFVKITSEI